MCAQRMLVSTAIDTRAAKCSPYLYTLAAGNTTALSAAYVPPLSRLPTRSAAPSANSSAPTGPRCPTAPE